MRLWIVVLAAAVANAFAGAASAADLPLKAPLAPVPVVNWTGCNINAGIGYGFDAVSHSTTNATGTVVFDNGHDNAGRGWLGRVGAGCDYQFASSFVLGALADFDWSKIHGVYSYTCGFGCAGPEGMAGDLNLSRTWAVGARFGFLVMPRLLAYIDGGYTQAHYDAAVLGDNTGVLATQVTVPQQTRGGWFIGGGTEYALGWWKGLAWRTEYRLANFGSQTAAVICTNNAGARGGVGCGGTGTVNALDTSNAYVQTITSSLVWRFNWQ
jgi:outer membrane immunogenic protein